MIHPFLTLHRRDFLKPGQWLHVARTSFTASTGWRFHTHEDFAEVFWIERGRGLHWINQQTMTLQAGDLVMIRRKDIHGVKCDASGELVLVNVAFDDSLLEELRRRYFPQRAWPWSGRGKKPFAIRLSPDIGDRLSQWADSLAPMSQSRLELEGFLIDLLRLTQTSSARTGYSPLPNWLVQALERMDKQPDAELSVRALAEQTGRSREHINRLVRRRLGRTTTQLLVEIRMRKAAWLLRMTDIDIMNVSMEVGLFNLSHFYRLFRQQYGTTPRKYRLHQQALWP